jgi:site-specific recombinase XerD
MKSNPAREVRGNSRPRTHSRATLTAEEVETLLATVARVDERGKRDYAFLKLMVGGALSEIEIIRADVSDLTMAHGYGSLKVQGKGRVRKDQAVLLPEDVNRAIDDYLHAGPTWTRRTRCSRVPGTVPGENA